MAANWDRCLERWIKAGLIDSSTSESIRRYEKEQEKARGLGWPVILAIAFGGLLLAAGILLFVAAHWDRLSPTVRFTMVLVVLAVLHVAGAITASRFAVLSTTLHAVGTICLGAGIFLAAQIFNLQEHWPSGVMLWAFGALVGCALFGDWPHAVLAAVLTPFWLAGEWSEATHAYSGAQTVLAAGLSLTAISYLTALRAEKRTPERIALAWVGGIILIPTVAAIMTSGRSFYWQKPLPFFYFLVGWISAVVLPLVFAWLMRRRSAWLNVLAAVWVAALASLSLQLVDQTSPFETTSLYGMSALGSVGLSAWGLREERRERVNLGVIGFALTVMFFYFSTFMDKLGRSMSLIGLGVLFLLGGWLLEKTRRRLVAGIGKGSA